MKKLLTLALLSAWLLPLVGHAQTPPPPNITVSFQTLGLGVEYTDIFIPQGEKYVPLQIELDSLSYKVVSYTGPMPMPLLRKVKTEKEIVYAPAGEVQFPVNNQPNQPNEFVLLFAPSSGKKLSVGVFKNDKVAFPADSVRVINVMRVPTGIMVNKTTGILQPGESKVLAMDNSNRAEIHIAVAKGDRWVEACNNVFPLAAEYRRTIFVIDVTNEGGPPRKMPLISLLSLAEAKIKPAPQPEEKAE